MLRLTVAEYDRELHAHRKLLSKIPELENEVGCLVVVVSFLFFYFLASGLFDFHPGGAHVTTILALVLTLLLTHFCLCVQIMSLMVQLQKERADTAHLCAVLGTSSFLLSFFLCLFVFLMAFFRMTCVTRSMLTLLPVSMFIRTYSLARTEDSTNPARYLALGGKDPTPEELSQRIRTLETRLNAKEVCVCLIFFLVFLCLFMCMFRFCVCFSSLYCFLRYSVCLSALLKCVCSLACGSEEICVCMCFVSLCARV